MSGGELDDILQRVQELQAAGHEHAWGMASFEARIERWPTSWGDNFVALVFGDFNPPDDPLVFDRLGITIEPEKQTNTAFKSALSVLRARVAVPEKSVTAVKDAAHRLNLLIGVLSFTSHGAPIRWWSHITSPTSGSIGYRLGDGSPDVVLSLIERLPPDIRKRVTAALYWLREPQGMLFEDYRANHFATYAGYWNAFECLVNAADMLVPRSRPTRDQKIHTIKARLDGLTAVRPKDIEALHREIVDPGLRTKAEHALRVCTAEKAEEFIRQCFSYDPDDQGLYEIRNAINHGTVDVDDPETAIVVEYRYPELCSLVFAMLRGVLTLNLKSTSDQ